MCVRASHVVTHRTTGLAQSILTYEIGRDRVYWSGFRLCLGISDNGYLSYDAYVPLWGNHIPTTNHRSTQGKEIKNWQAAYCSAVEVSFPSVRIDYWRPLRASTHRNLLLLWEGSRRFWVAVEDKEFPWTINVYLVIQLTIHLFLPSHRPSC